MKKGMALNLSIPFIFIRFEKFTSSITIYDVDAYPFQEAIRIKVP